MYLAQTKIFVYYILPRDLQFFPILQILECSVIFFNHNKLKRKDIQTKKEKFFRTSLSTQSRGRTGMEVNPLEIGRAHV